MSQYIETETEETSGEATTPTVSGNDTGDGGTVEGGSFDSGTAVETGGSGENGGTEPETPVTPPPSGGTETPSSPSDTENFADSVLSGLDAISGKLDEAPSYDTLAESLRSLVDIMTVQAEEELRTVEGQEGIPVSVPLADYESYAYPVSVTYRLYPSGLGSETDAVETYADAEGFGNGYSAMRDAMEDGTLAWFSILSVDDAEGVRVYDASPFTDAEDSPGTEEPDTFREDVLSALDTLHEDLQSVSMNDIGYYAGSLDLAQTTLDLQEQCLALQQENRELSYHMLACDIATGFVLLLALGYTIARGFFQRMKAG